MLENKGTNQYFITRQESTESNARSYPRKFPFALAKASGSWVEDVEGNKYLDFLCGAGTLALGHNDPEVNQAMVELITSGAPLHTLDLTTPTKDAFVETLLSKLPGEMGKNSKIQFCSPSGTDATDAANAAKEAAEAADADMINDLTQDDGNDTNDIKFKVSNTDYSYEGDPAAAMKVALTSLGLDPKALYVDEEKKSKLVVKNKTAEDLKGLVLYAEAAGQETETVVTDPASPVE